MTVRGFVWAYYVSDDGNTYALKVDADYAPMPERGWVFPAAMGTPVYPRGWLPRKVVGLDESGHPREAVVASVGADLWTRVALTFHFYATDETLHTANVTRYLTENMKQRPT